MSEKADFRSIEKTESGREIVVTRRDFLGFVWKGLLGLSTVLGLGAIWRFLSYQPEPAPPILFDLGLAEGFPEGIRATISEADAVLQHPAQGLEAFSLVCPHLGCIVELTQEGFACPCHGSKFGMRGELKHGPADKPLRSLRLEVQDNGHLILNTASE